MYNINIINQKYFIEVNCYLIKTNIGFILIDTGLPKKRSLLLRELESVGCISSNLNLIIITHGHFDHNGNTSFISKKYGSKIAMHLGDLGMAESGDMFINMKGIKISLIRGLLPFIGMDRYDSFKPDLILENNSELSIFGLESKVIHLPGHSKGSIGILTVDGDFFCGDLFVNNKRPEKNTLIDNQVEYDESISKMFNLKIRYIYPGHGKPFKIDELNN